MEPNPVRKAMRDLTVQRQQQAATQDRQARIQARRVVQLPQGTQTHQDPPESQEKRPQDKVDDNEPVQDEHKTSDRPGRDSPPVTLPQMQSSSQANTLPQMQSSSQANTRPEIQTSRAGREASMEHTEGDSGRVPTVRRRREARLLREAEEFKRSAQRSLRSKKELLQSRVGRTDPYAKYYPKGVIQLDPVEPQLLEIRRTRTQTRRQGLQQPVAILLPAQFFQAPPELVRQIPAATPMYRLTDLPDLSHLPEDIATRIQLIPATRAFTVEQQAARDWLEQGLEDPVHILFPHVPEADPEQPPFAVQLLEDLYEALSPHPTPQGFLQIFQRFAEGPVAMITPSTLKIYRAWSDTKELNAIPDGELQPDNPVTAFLFALFEPNLIEAVVDQTTDILASFRPHILPDGQQTEDVLSQMSTVFNTPIRMRRETGTFWQTRLACNDNLFRVQDIVDFGQPSFSLMVFTMTVILAVDFARRITLHNGIEVSANVQALFKLFSENLNPEQTLYIIGANAAGPILRIIQTRQNWAQFFLKAYFISRSVFLLAQAADLVFPPARITEITPRVLQSQLASSTIIQEPSLDRPLQNKVAHLNQALNLAVTNEGQNPLVHRSTIKVSIDLTSGLLYHYAPVDQTVIVQADRLLPTNFWLEYNPHQAIHFGALVQQLLAHLHGQAQNLQDQSGVVDFHTVSIIYAAVLISQRRCILPGVNQTVYSTVQLKMKIDARQIYQDEQDIIAKYFTCHLVIPQIPDSSVTAHTEIYREIVNSLNDTLVQWMLAYEPEFSDIQIGSFQVQSVNVFSFRSNSKLPNLMRPLQSRPFLEENNQTLPKLLSSIVPDQVTHAFHSYLDISHGRPSLPRLKFASRGGQQRLSAQDSGLAHIGSEATTIQMTNLLMAVSRVPVHASYPRSIQASFIRQFAVEFDPNNLCLQLLVDQLVGWTHGTEAYDYFWSRFPDRRLSVQKAVVDGDLAKLVATVQPISQHLFQAELYFVAQQKEIVLGRHPPCAYFFLFADHLYRSSCEKVESLKVFLARRSKPAPLPSYFTSLTEIVAPRHKAKQTRQIRVFFDIETYTREPFKPYVLGFSVEGAATQYIYDDDCCAAFVAMIADMAAANATARISVIGFNAYKFDYQYLLPAIIQIWKDEVLLVGTKTDIKMLHAANVFFEDLRALLGGSGSLDGIARSFTSQMTKGHLDFDAIQTPDDVERKRTLIEEYLNADVQLLPIIYDGFLRRLHDIIAPQTFPDLDFATSLSAFVLRAYFRYFTAPLQTDRFQSVSHHQRDYFRQSYHGGRVCVPSLAIQCQSEFAGAFERYLTAQRDQNHVPVTLNADPLYYCDINSSYPHIMTKDMPCGQMHFEPVTERVLTEPVKRVLYRVSSFIFADGVTPILPTVSLDGTLVYPLKWNEDYAAKTKNTPLRLLFWGVELWQAIERGCVVTYDGEYSWEQQYPIFRHFIRTIYDVRLRAKQQKDQPMVQATKLLMNSLSGKLGQRTFDSQFLLDLALLPHCSDEERLGELVYSSAPQPANKRVTKVDPVTDRVLQISVQNTPVTDTQNPGCFVHLISFITAYARARLAKMELIAGMREFYYADTDSLVVSAQGYKNLHDHGFLHETVLGRLKVEHKCALFHALSPKCYILGEVSAEGAIQVSARAKGINLKKIEKDPVALQEYFIGACSSGSITLEQTQFRRHFGFVDIHHLMKTTTAKRRTTQVGGDGSIHPPATIDDYEKKQKSIYDILYLN